MKLCKDCKHFVNYWNISEHRCYALAKLETDPVTGREYYWPVKKNNFADKELRRFGEECGPDGELFEAKPIPWWKFWRSK